jgi:DNA polymerase III epsilon subunit-like protein
MITLALCLANTGIQRSGSLDDPQYPRPVAIGACQWDCSGVFAEYRSYIRQEDKSISTSAEMLHGISDRIARSRGVNERVPLSWLTHSLRTSKRVVGWDLDFDLDVIRAALIRHKGNPAELIRPQLETTNLVDICATIVGKQDANGEAVAPSIAEALTVIAPGAEIDPSNPRARAEACRVIFEALCLKDQIADMQEAA